MNRRLLLLVITSFAVISLGACGKKNIRETPANPSETSAQKDEGELFAVSPNGSAEGAAGGAEEGGDNAGTSAESQGINDVFFAFDSSEITAEGRTTLGKDATIISRLGSQYQIEGHCDERGSAEYNLALGDRRARAVRDYVVTLGVDPASLSTISYGEERPFANGHDESAWSQNRRGHFVIK